MRLHPCLLVIFLCCWTVVAQHRPIQTESAETLAPRTVVVEVGGEYLKDAVYPLSGLRGNLTRVGVFAARFGFGSVEFELAGTGQETLSVQERTPAPYSGSLDFTGNRTHDVGDLALATKIRLVPQTEKRPAIGFQFGVKLPNASNERGLGTDTTDAFGVFLLEKKLGQLSLIANAGVAILGDPTTAASQDDLLKYGAAAMYALSPRWSLFADWNGRTGPGGVGTEDQSRVRAGAQVQAGGIVWDFGGVAGLSETDPDWGIAFGLSKKFQW